MILRTDDDLYDVDQRWLGPPGRELPWHARYPAYGWGVVIYLTLMLLERNLLGIPLGFWMLVYSLVLTAFLTTRVMRRVTVERRVGQVITGWGQELRSPRPADRTRRGRRDWERGGRVRLAPVRTRSMLPVAERPTG